MTLRSYRKPPAEINPHLPELISSLNSLLRQIILIQPQVTSSLLGPDILPVVSVFPLSRETKFLNSQEIRELQLCKF